MLPNDTDRRVLSHLSIPRNVDDIAQQLRTDKGWGLKVDGDELHRRLGEFADAGWVINLGEHTDMAKLAHKVEKSTARTMPDEKAAIFARRRAAENHRWRVDGDVWMYTDDGRDASRESTQLLVPPPLTTSQVRAAIGREWARTLHDAPLAGSLHDEIGGRLPANDDGTDAWGESLANQLLPEEFAYWLKAVLKSHEEIWGKNEADELRRDLPVAGGSQFSDAYEILLLDAENQKTNLAASAAPWHMALVETSAVTDADTGSTLDEPEYTGYARKTVAAADMNAAAGTGGSVTNANAITFAACTALTDTVIGFAHCVALTVGVMRKFGTTASTVISTTQTPATFAVNAYTTTIA